MSARWPSTPRRAQVPAISSTIRSGRRTDRARPRGGHALRERGLLRRPARGERRRVAVERQPAADDLDPHGRVERTGDLDREPEAVEQLRAQVALLGVHRADQHEAGVVGGGQAVALDVHAAERGRVEQHVDQVVGQQVDLVDVQQPAVGRRQQARLERGGTVGQAHGRGRACRGRGPRSRRSAARPGRRRAAPARAPRSSWRCRARRARARRRSPGRPRTPAAPRAGRPGRRAR